MKKLFISIAALFLILNSFGQTWSELGGLNSLSANSYIYSICKNSSNTIFAAGNFTNANGTKYVAKFNGTSWIELGSANPLNANAFIYTICSDAAGNIYAAGDFTNASGNRYVAKFDGTNWTELGGNNSLAANGTIYKVFADAAGNVYAGGFFMNGLNNRYVAKFNGTSWSELGGQNSLITNGNIFGICSDGSGNIYAAGQFTNATFNKYVAKFNGSTWSEVGGTNALAANSDIFTLFCDQSNNLYVGGAFNVGSGFEVEKYNGSTWSVLGGTNTLLANDFIQSISSDASGNVYVAGNFTNSSGNRYVAKFNGTAWSELGGNNLLAANGNIKAVIVDGNGIVYAGGLFSNINSTKYVAFYGCLGNVNPSVVISTPSLTVCQGSQVTITANPANGGLTPNYNFKVNGLSVQNSGINTYVTTGLSNGNTISCVMTSSLTSCISTQNATSNNLIMTVNSAVTPYVSISANPAGSVCINTLVTISASQTNGGSNPVYTFKINGTTVQNNNSNSYTSSSFVNNDVINVILNSTASCATSTTANSNSDTMHINNPAPPLVSITANPSGIISAGTSVTFTANTSTPGSNPVYTFKINSTIYQSSSANTFTTTALHNNDTVKCILTTNANCLTTNTATSNQIIENVGSVGIEGIQSNDWVIISPNPVSNQICISSNSENKIYEIDICNLLGQILISSKSTEGFDSKTIDLSALSSGIYLVKIFNHTENSLIKKFVKK